MIKAPTDLDSVRTTNHSHKSPNHKSGDKKRKGGGGTTESNLSTAPHLIPGNYMTTNYKNNHPPTPPSISKGSSSHNDGSSIGIAGIRVQTPTEPDLPELIEPVTERPAAPPVTISIDPISIDKAPSEDFGGKLFFDDNYANFYSPDYVETTDYASADQMNKFRTGHAQNSPSPAASEDVASRTMLSGQSVQEVRDPIASSESVHPSGSVGNHQFMDGTVFAPNHHHDGLPGFPPPRGSFITGDHSRTAELAADGAGFIIDEPNSNHYGSFMESSHVIDRTPKTSHNQGHANNNNNRFGRYQSADHQSASNQGLASDQMLASDQIDNNNQETPRFSKQQFPVYSPASQSSSSASPQLASPQLASPQLASPQLASPVSVQSTGNQQVASGLQKLPVFIEDSNQGNFGVRNRDANQGNKDANQGRDANQGSRDANHGRDANQSYGTNGYNRIGVQRSSQASQQQVAPKIPLGMPMAGLLTLSSSNYLTPNANSASDQFFPPPQSASSSLMSASLAQSSNSNLPGVSTLSRPSSGSQVVEKLSAAAQSIASSFIPQSLFPRRLGHLLPASFFNPVASNANQRFDSLPTLTHENYANRYKRSLFQSSSDDIRSNHHPGAKSLDANNASDGKIKEMTASESGYFNFDEDDADFERPNIPPPLFDPSLSSGFEGSSSNNRRGSSRRRGRARSISRNAYSSEGVESKKSYGILGSGNFEVIRGGIYGDEGGESSESYRTHRNPPIPPPIDDYDDASNTRKRYSFGPPDSDSDYFGKDGAGVLGFQGYDNFQLASNQEEDKSDLDKSASHRRPITKSPFSGSQKLAPSRIASQSLVAAPSRVSNTYASHSGTVLLDSDQDLMADS